VADNTPDLGFVFWPVGTGDSTTVVVDEDTLIQIDLHDLAKADDETAPETPVVDQLIEVLPIRDGVPYLAAFVLTHADKDHCLGFADLLSVTKIGELWATPRLWREFEESDGDGLCEDAQAFHEEVLRRVDATLTAVASGNKPASGDRVLIIGHDSSGAGYSYHDLPDEYITGPGHSITVVDGREHAGHFGAFVHAPFVDDCAKERNETSVALQVTLTDEPSGVDGKVLLFGDLAHDTIMKIFDYSEAQGREQYLQWDVLLAPHHCSKKVMYADTDGDGDEEYLDDVMMALDRHAREPRVIISSSNPTPFSDTSGANPPHRIARDRYEEIADIFACTMEWPTAVAPSPLVLAVGAEGAQLVEPETAIELSESLSKSSSFGRLAVVAAAAAAIGIEAGRRHQQRRSQTNPAPTAPTRGADAVRNAIVTDRGSAKAPLRPTGFGR
jgi:beta-lactamase superfamily II metal-dependent hydrolase